MTPPPRRDFSQFGKRRPVRGGIEARSRRGTFGSTWWGRSLVESVERLADAGRMSRGRTYARAGQVVDLHLLRGEVRAEVQGSQPEPFESVFSLRIFDDDRTAELVDAIRATPGMLAEIVSGSLPQAVGSAAAAADRERTRLRLHLPGPGLALQTRRRGGAADCGGDRRAPARHPHPAWRRPRHPDRGRRTRAGRRSPTTSTATASTCPTCPTVEFRPAPDDLDPLLLRRALRETAAGEREVAAGLRDLDAAYRRLAD